MDELIPLILDDKVILNQVNWCFAHKQNCVRGPLFETEHRDELNLLLLGSPCVVTCSQKKSLFLIYELLKGAVSNKH